MLARPVAGEQQRERSGEEGSVDAESGVGGGDPPLHFSFRWQVPPCVPLVVTDRLAVPEEGTLVREDAAAGVGTVEGVHAEAGVLVDEVVVVVTAVADELPCLVVAAVA